MNTECVNTNVRYLQEIHTTAYHSNFLQNDEQASAFLKCRSCVPTWFQPPRPRTEVRVRPATDLRWLPERNWFLSRSSEIIECFLTPAARANARTWSLWLLAWEAEGDGKRNQTSSCRPIATKFNCFSIRRWNLMQGRLIINSWGCEAMKGVTVQAGSQVAKVGCVLAVSGISLTLRTPARLTEMLHWRCTCNLLFHVLEA